MSPAPLIYTKTYRILGIRHGIEWAERHWEFIDDVVVGVVLRADDPSQALLNLVLESVDMLAKFSRDPKHDTLDIVQHLSWYAFLHQEVDRLLEREPERALRALAPLELLPRGTAGGLPRPRVCTAGAAWRTCI